VSVIVHDPFNVAADPKMPFLHAALEPEQAWPRLQGGCARLRNAAGQARLRSIKVVRHKPGRRCLIEYEVELMRSNRAEVLGLLGKARAKGLDHKAHDLLRRFWESDFGPDSPDGISVPEPVGLVPEFQMWLQAKVPGTLLTELVLKKEGEQWMRRVAEAARKIHQSAVPARRSHMMRDELDILHQRLGEVAQLRPEWHPRLERLLAACERLGASVPELAALGIHRDFYPAQVILSDARIYVVDFDSYCNGDPALDIGNFIGHLTEQSLRELGESSALAEQERALEERFIELAGESCRAAVGSYATLTLVRHVYLSTQFAERRKFTEPLLELCEQRLGLARYCR